MEKIMTDIKEQELKAILEIDLSVVEPQLREKSRAIKASFAQLGKKEFGGSKQNIDYLQKSIEFICMRHPYKHTDPIKKNIQQFIQKLTEVKANSNVIPDLKKIESQANELIDLHNKYVDLCVMAKRWSVVPDIDKNTSRGYFEFKNQLGVISKDSINREKKIKEYNKDVIHSTSYHCFKNKTFNTAKFQYQGYSQSDFKPTKFDTGLLKLDVTNKQMLNLYVKPEGLEIKETIINEQGITTYVSLGFIPLEALLNIEEYYKNKYQGGAECE